MPYDRFVRLQLAGDEVAPDDPSAFIATGFNRCYPDMVDLNDQRLRRQNALERHHRDDRPGLPRPDDRLRPLPRPQVRPDPPGGFLPAPGVLRRVAVPRRLSPGDVRAADGVREGRWPPGGPRSPTVQAAILRIEKPVRDRLAPGLPMGALDDAVAAYNKPESERTPAEVATVYGLLSRDGRIRPADWPRLLDPAASSRRQGAARRARPRDEGRAPSAADGPGDRRGRARGPADLFPPPRRAHRRGPAVAPAFPAVLATAESAGPPIAPLGRLERPPPGAGRLADAARSSADGAGDGQPALAGALRPRPGGHVQRLRHGWATSPAIPSCSTGWRPSWSRGAGASRRCTG